MLQSFKEILSRSKEEDTPAQPEEPQELDYNKTYELLVDDEADLTGIIAYGIYKSEKRKLFINHATTPSKAEIEGFKQAVRRESYRTEAEIILYDFVEEASETRYQELVSNYDKLARNTSAFKSIFFSVVASFIFSILLTIIIYIALHNKEIKETVEKLLLQNKPAQTQTINHQKSESTVRTPIAPKPTQ